MALVSFGVMLLNIVSEMPKFGWGTVEGNFGSFSGVPLLGESCVRYELSEKQRSQVFSTLLLSQISPLER